MMQILVVTDDSCGFSSTWSYRLPLFTTLSWIIKLITKVYTFFTGWCAGNNTYAKFVASVHICGSLLGTLLADMNLMRFLARGSAFKDMIYWLPLFIRIGQLWNANNLHHLRLERYIQVWCECLYVYLIGLTAVVRSMAYGVWRRLYGISDCSFVKWHELKIMNGGRRRAFYARSLHLI